MSDSASGDERSGATSPSFVFGGMWALLFLSAFLVAGPWAGFHGIFLGVVGLLMLLAAPVARLPRSWWILAACFIVGGASAFLPAAWFPQPEWRGTLEGLGVNTGTSVVIQARQAAEAYSLFVMTLLAGLWLVGQRSSGSQARIWALAFTLGVATYALASKALQAEGGNYGFFPNRNHTATYLAMGTICGLGSVLQALRDRRFVAMSFALAATTVCLWAVAGWSISRAGVVLVILGCLAWLPILGRRYLGSHGLRALGLIALAGTGMFFIADSGVKGRLTKTMENAGKALSAPPDDDFGKPATTAQDLDFRIPTALDTFDLIRDFKWTGIGAGQFRYIFPQYKNRTAVANDSDSYHPESDWLWMAAETGLPATLALAALVVLAFRKSLGAILEGRDRAVRGACLVAALLVPLHGVFDVPGHRITLALSAAFLFSLSRHPSVAAAQYILLPFWPQRFAALALLTAAAFLLHSQWFGGRIPPIREAEIALTEARKLYAKDRALLPNRDPAPQEDLLEKALQIVGNAAKTVPLHRELRHYEGFLALHFDDLLEEARQAYGIERELDPTWIQSPLHQAASWSNTSPDETARLWDEAIRRARAMDRQFPNQNWEATAVERIRQQVSTNPALRPHAAKKFEP